MAEYRASLEYRNAHQPLSADIGPPVSLLESELSIEPIFIECDECSCKPLPIDLSDNDYLCFGCRANKSVIEKFLEQIDAIHG